MQPHILFLPGAGGSPGFWRPVGDLLPAHWRKSYVGWPGLGEQPHDPNVHGLDDLVTLAEKNIDGPVLIAAQSMGGIIAIRLALKHPRLVRGLVLTVTSGGIDLTPHAPADWRADYARAFPNAAAWIFTAKADHAAELPRIAVPALLIWGDADAISPVSVGKELAHRLPMARLHVVSGGTHDLVHEAAAETAGLVQRHAEGLTWS